MVTVEEIGGLMYQFFILVIQLAAPILLVGMAVGIAIAILQAATQIHEQTLSFVPKLLALGCVLVFAGGSMMQRLKEFTEQVFAMIAG